MAQQTGGNETAQAVPLFSMVAQNEAEVLISLTQTSSDKVLADAAMYNKSTSGMMVMFTLIFMLTSAASLIWERELGTLRRLQVMPLQNHQILLGKMLGVYCMGVVQLLVLALSNLLMFDLFSQVNLVGMLVMILVFGFTAAGLGMLIAALARSLEQASALTLILVICISALGGAWWPLELVSQMMQTVATAFPTYWALNGFYQVMHLGAGVADILLPLSVLFGFGGIFLAIGLYKFKF
jgi:ABC-2 type transport system permease protein